jgi:DNA gyrase subunit B
VPALTAAPRTPVDAAAKPAKTSPAPADSYTARHLSVLEGLDAVRKRPGMYVGSTDGRGLQHCLWEIIDNAVDEALGGYCTRIDVLLHADGSAEVRDNGRGIPVDAERKTKLSGVELVMTRLHAGGKFGGGSYTASGGLHGVGASVVNALAARLDVEVDRGGRTWAASFRRGVTGEFAGPAPDADFTKRSGLRELGRAARSATGTRIRFWPDRQVFLKDARFSFDSLTERARQTAYLVPGLTISIREEGSRGEGSRGEGSGAERVPEQGLREEGALEDILREAAPEAAEPRHAEFRFDGGISEFCAHLGSGEAVTEVLRLTGAGNFTETIPVLDDKGHMTATEVERELNVDVAVQWGSGYDSVVRSFVNVIATPHGGTHVTGFERAMVRTLNDQLRTARLLKNGDEPVTKEDTLEGLVAVISVRLPEPQFEGQTKEVLGTPAASRIVAQVVGAQLKAYLENPPRGAKQQARSVLEKVVSAAKARIAAREHRDNQRRKSALASSSLPAKLVDCRSADDRSELFIVEGDSALGTARRARDSEFQALLPIRGKILNVQKASLADMLKNTECAAIIQVIGAGSGSSFDLDSARYQRVVLMSVAPNEPVLLTDRDGRFTLRRIGAAIDEVINSEDQAWLGETISVDLAGRSTRISPLKQLIRHHYRGEMYEIRTAYGRSVTVTGGHSVFTYEHGELTLKPASELRLGDLVVAPRQLPRPAPQHEIDLAALLHRTGHDDAIRIEGEAVRRLLALKAAARQPAHLRRDISRIRLSKAAWASLAQARKARGITCAAMAEKLGYRQACSVSEFETGRSLPPEPVFRRYLTELGEPWPDAAEVVASLVDQWSGTTSRNERYRSVAPATWLASLSDEDLSWLAAQDDGRDVVLYARAHREDTVSRFLPVTEELCYLLGWYLAEGSVGSRGARLNFSLGANDDRYIPSLAAAIQTVTGRAPMVVTPTGFPNSRHLYVPAPVLGRVIKALGMGGKATRKRVPDVLLNCSEENQLAFLEGYFLGDGSKASRGSQLTFATSSIDLANGLLYLLGQLGILAGLSRSPGGESRICGRDVVTGQSYQVRVSGKEALHRLRRLWRSAPTAEAYDAHLSRPATRMGCEPISGDLVGLPIRMIRKLDYDGDVYDLSVPDDENFISGTGGLLSHNTDADVDGAHIRTLLLTLFHRYLRPMLEAGRVFAAVPPLHRIELSNVRKGQDKYRYTYSDAELTRTLLELERRGQRWKDPIQRYKGLGEMDADQLAETTMDPRHRTLRRIRLEDAVVATEVFSMLMGNEVAPRRDFIINGAAELDPSRIDT